MRVLVLILITLSSSNALCGFWDKEPKTYEECITKNMKGVTSDVAAQRITGACRKMFPKITPTSYLLSEDQRKSLPCQADIINVGTASGRESRLEGVIYNGNKLLNITKIKVFVKTLENEEVVTRDYWHGIDIPPLSNAYFTIPVWPLQGDRFRWGIHEAYGYRIQ